MSDDRPRKRDRRKADRRHGFPRRSTDWRDPETLQRVPERLHGLCSQIADALDDLELRRDDRRRS